MHAIFQNTNANLSDVQEIHLGRKNAYKMCAMKTNQQGKKQKHLMETAVITGM